jgi:hypothetical protein
VIATASTEEKRRLAIDLGADAAVDPNDRNLHRALREANGGEKVDVVLEMAGGHVFDESLRALAPFGRLVAYGMASGEPREVGAAGLMQGSKAVVGFWLVHCLGGPAWSRSPSPTSSRAPPGASCGRSWGRRIRCRRPHGPTRTSGRGGRAGSCCSIRAAEDPRDL